MIKDFLRASLGVLAVAVMYLLVAHFYIYHKIGVVGLKTTDNRHKYMVNEQITDKKDLIYVSLGDSLTSGVGTERYEQSYPYLLTQKISGDSKKVTNVNFSYPGARTEDLIRDLLPKAVSEKADIVTLLIGTNDVHGNISSESFAKNYGYILSELTQKTSAKINIINIPFIGADNLLVPPYDRYYSERISAFNKIIKALSVKYKVHYIDLNSATAQLSPGAPGYYAEDDFHPSSAGYKIWADYIYEHLNQ